MLPDNFWLPVAVGIAPNTLESTTKSPVLLTLHVKLPIAEIWNVVGSLTEALPVIITCPAGSPPTHWMSTPAETVIVVSASALVQAKDGAGIVNVAMKGPTSAPPAPLSNV